MTRWFHTLSIQKKLIISYIFLVGVPMFLVALFAYQNMNQTLLEHLSTEMSSQLEKTSQTIDDITDNYYAVSDTFYRDSDLMSYLIADYTEAGYEKLYPYVDGHVRIIETMYPAISAMSFYTTNRSLPQDQYYFYYLTDGEAVTWSSRIPNGSIFHLEHQEGVIIFRRLLNLYESGGCKVYLEMRLDEKELEKELTTINDAVTAFLVDENGWIYLSGNDTLAGKDYSECDFSDQILLEQPTQYCGTLYLCTDRNQFEKQARTSASNVLVLFGIASVAAFFRIYLYSHKFQQNVDRVREGARQIGSGEFTYKIEDVSGAELTQIADSVNTMGEQINTLIEESYKKELAKKSSDLNLLQEQINPHFLYNALSAISSMAMRSQDRETSGAIASLSEFYRLSLNKGRREMTIRDELKLLGSYLKIQKLRFGDDIEVEYEMDEALFDREIMKLTLQPLVENAVHHGRTDKEDTLHILVRLFEERDKTIFEVIDDGCGIPMEKLLKLQESLNQSRDGFGMRNVNLRIKMQYGDAYGLYIESEPGLGTKVRVELPGGAAAKNYGNV